MTTAVSVLPAPLVRCQRWCLAVGIVALSAFVVGGVFDPPQFFRAYLAAYLFYFGIAMGSMTLLMIYHITGGAWGFLVRRILEAGMRTLPLVALGFIPIGAGARYVYPWAQPDVVAANELLRQQQVYFNPPFFYGFLYGFYGRAVLYFALWLIMAYFLSAWSRAQDRTGNPRLAWRCDGLSSIGLVIYGISIHFASVDWLMSLQPAFHSTIFGPLVASGHLLSGLALAVIVLAALCRHTPLSEIVSPKALGDLGNLLLSFLIVWAYMCWFQYMLIWIANLPVDVVWYLPRLSGGWQWVALALVVLHFLVPFFLLLFRAVKQDIRVLAWVAGLMLVMQLVFMVYQVAPAFHAAELTQHWMNFWLPSHWAESGLHSSCGGWPGGRFCLHTTRTKPPRPTCAKWTSVKRRGRRRCPMSEKKDRDHADEPIEHPAARYERSDARFGWIMAVIVAAVCLACVHYYVMWSFYLDREQQQQAAKTSRYPLAPKPLTSLPPEPRLEQLDRVSGIETRNTNRRELTSEQTLAHYGPTAEKGYIHVPIERAMELVIPELPVRKQTEEGPAKDNGLLDAGAPNSGSGIAMKTLRSVKYHGVATPDFKTFEAEASIRLSSCLPSWRVPSLANAEITLPPPFAKGRFRSAA